MAARRQSVRIPCVIRELPSGESSHERAGYLSWVPPAPWLTTWPSAHPPPLLAFTKHQTNGASQSSTVNLQIISQSKLFLPRLPFVAFVNGIESWSLKTAFMTHLETVSWSRRLQVRPEVASGEKWIPDYPHLFWPCIQDWIGGVAKTKRSVTHFTKSFKINQTLTPWGYLIYHIFIIFSSFSIAASHYTSFQTFPFLVF